MFYIILVITVLVLICIGSIGHLLNEIFNYVEPEDEVQDTTKTD